ncbi:NAD(P)/FAD-dependent oxidoreductase [Treponema sp.]
MSLFRIHQLVLPLDAPLQELRQAAARTLYVQEKSILTLSIEKKSIDARDKGDLKFVYGVLLDLDTEPRKLPQASIASRAQKAQNYKIPSSIRSFKERPLVVGTGPAGLFAGLILAEAGARPLIFERGDRVEQRDVLIRGFEAGSSLDEESNIQFGEGGAGTYSDGKLTTQVKDEGGRRGKVLAELIAAGAPEEIAILSKPHIGTDKLVLIVAALRKKIEVLGGEFRFRSRVDGFDIQNAGIAAVRVAGGERIPSGFVILAPGHSARDTFKMLTDAGVEMERKSFAVGLRIEHPQAMISQSQYGKQWEHPNLPVAEYKLTGRSADGRGVYSFCMCPGGRVVNASSENLGVVCNGMSDFARDAENANSAIVVSVSPDDFGSKDLLAGIEFQRNWERAAFKAGGGRHRLPMQLVSDFIEGRISTRVGDVQPSLRGDWAFGDLSTCLPRFVIEGIRQGLGRFGSSIRGFDRGDALLSGVETRSSSPLRILRDEHCEASLRGLFPAGEGAGYAGGIMSAAMDGIRVAEQVLSQRP